MYKKKYYNIVTFFNIINPEGGNRKKTKNKSEAIYQP